MLKATAGRSVKELKLRIYGHKFDLIIASIQEWTNQGYPLPSVINICSEGGLSSTSELFKFWSLSSSELPSFEINVYDNKNLPTNLYPSVPLRNFKFGSAATPPLIRLSNHGIVGLKFDIFHLREYDHYGTVRHAITPGHDLHQLLTEEEHFNHDIHLHSVSYVDISNLSANFHHLEQLALVCPNIQRLNLQGNIDCFRMGNFQGLRAIVNSCQNLEILSLNRISHVWVESYLPLWTLLSSLKKLTHLAVELCMVMLYTSDDAYKQRIITTLKGCCRLESMEIEQHINYCFGCRENRDLLLSYFPSLAYCKMLNFRCSKIAYAITNCHQLKSLSEITDDSYHSLCEESLQPLLNNCHLQYLCIRSVSLTSNLSDELVEVLSAHGELERVCLEVNSITFNGINTLIMNSPNLISLHVTIRNPLFSEDVSKYHDGDYEKRVRKMFPYHKLFDIGNVIIRNSS